MSYKDPTKYILVRHSGRYGVVHPGHPVPLGWDHIKDCDTMEEAELLGIEYMESDVALDGLGCGHG